MLNNMNMDELNQKIQELVHEIQFQSFVGTPEEIKFQQILYFDKYVKDNIEYGFDAINYSIEHPNQNNPYNSAFSLEGFFMPNEINGKRLAVCGSISEVANKVFRELGIECNYVYGHFNFGNKENPKYLGHRWNVVSIADKQYMVDFTLGMVIHNINKNAYYDNMSQTLLGVNSDSSEYDYLFFDKLAPAESIGGFKKNENGTSVDDLDESGYLRNAITEPKNVYEKLGVIPKEHIYKYINTLFNEKRL